MPAPTNERQALEREQQELASLRADYRRELDATPQEQRERRERLEWQIRRVEKRMVTVRAWLAENAPADGCQWARNVRAGALGGAVNA